MVGGERVRVVAVRLTPAEHEAWLAAATAAGRGRLGTWVREQVTTSLAAAAADGSAAVPAGDDVDVTRLRGELVRVGNNLNQAVRLAHVERTAAGSGASSAGGGLGPWGAVGAAAAVDLAVGELRVVLRAVHDLAATTGGHGGGKRSAGAGAAPGAARGARGAAGGGR